MKFAFLAAIVGCLTPAFAEPGDGFVWDFLYQAHNLQRYVAAKGLPSADKLAAAIEGLQVEATSEAQEKAVVVDGKRVKVQRARWKALDTHDKWTVAADALGIESGPALVNEAFGPDAHRNDLPVFDDSVSHWDRLGQLFQVAKPPVFENTVGYWTGRYFTYYNRYNANPIAFASESVAKSGPLFQPENSICTYGEANSTNPFLYDEIGLPWSNVTCQTIWKTRAVTDANGLWGYQFFQDQKLYVQRVMQYGDYLLWRSYPCEYQLIPTLDVPIVSVGKCDLENDKHRGYFFKKVYSAASATR